MCVCVLHTQQLVLLLVCIVRPLAPQLLPRSLLWLPPLSTLLPPPEHPLVTPLRLGRSVAGAAAASVSVRAVTRLGCDALEEAE